MVSEVGSGPLNGWILSGRPREPTHQFFPLKLNIYVMSEFVSYSFIMAEEHFAQLIEVFRAQNEFQQQMMAQNQLRNLENGQALPTYSGKKEEDVLDFVETVNREANAGNWNEEQKIRLAKGALRETAAEWRWLHEAEVPRDWIGWSIALCAAFRKRYTFAEWEKMVTRRVQLENETGPQYALIKAKLRRHCPYPMTEADFIPYLIQGIRHRQFRTVLLQNPPLTVTTFIQSYGLLEQNSDRAPDQALTQLEARIEKQSQEIAELKKEIGKGRRFQPYDQPRPQRPVAPPSGSRRCYQCDKEGHLQRDCPFEKKINRTENDKAGTVGQFRQ